MEDFILVIPRWDEQFSFTYDVVAFVLLWLSIVTGLLLCFWGYKYGRAMFLFVLGCIVATLGLAIAENMTQNMVLKMYIFVMFTFVCVCVLYLLSRLLSTLLYKLQVLDRILNKMYIITAVAGGLVIGGAVYLRIYHHIWVAVVVSIGLAFVGSLYGKRKTAVQKPFLTYDDLYRMQPLKEGDSDA